VYLGVSELRVVEEEGGLRGSLLLKGDSGVLGLSSRLKFKLGDLTTV
jgi:hypothetical protein